VHSYLGPPHHMHAVVKHLEHLCQFVGVVRVRRSRPEGFAHFAGQVGGNTETVSVAVSLRGLQVTVTTPPLSPLLLALP
jgi:hypothetical protein